jgi:hypothetical protein
VAYLTKVKEFFLLVEKLLPVLQTKALVPGSVGLLQSSNYKKAKKSLLHAHNSRETGA